ncbi:MAG: EMI1 family protein [Kocuria palustris]|nr:EMI1 family protein [Kocuria palustris]
MTPDEQADLEFNQILTDLRSEDASLSKRTGLTPDGNLSPESQTPSSPISPESLYQDTMSCRNAFDYAFFCQSFGGQFVNVYRYGELRSCSDHWDNLWLCMKTRTWPEDLRRREIRDHNRKKAIKYKTGPSSEDVWDVRLDPAKDSFKGDFAAMWEEMKAEDEAAKQQAEKAVS